MNKVKFIYELRRRLKDLPRRERDRLAAYYEEIIDDRIEDGMSERQAVAALGHIEDIVRYELVNTNAHTHVNATAPAPKRRKSGFLIAAAIIGFPIWLPLILTAFVLFITIDIVLLTLVLCLFTVVIAFGATGIAGFLTGIVLCFTPFLTTGIALMGAGLVSAALCLVCLRPALLASKALFKLIGSSFIWVSQLFTGKKGDK